MQPHLLLPMDVVEVEVEVEVVGGTLGIQWIHRVPVSRSQASKDCTPEVYTYSA